MMVSGCSCTSAAQWVCGAGGTSADAGADVVAIEELIDRVPDGGLVVGASSWGSHQASSKTSLILFMSVFALDGSVALLL